MNLLLNLLLLITIAYAQDPDRKPTIDSRGRQLCGSNRWPPHQPCDADSVCVDDPYSGGCGQKCDAPGICAKKIPCGGSARIACTGKCVREPGNYCNPLDNGVDCRGVCVPPAPGLP